MARQRISTILSRSTIAIDMAIYRKREGPILRAPGGGLANSSDCCCGCSCPDCTPVATLRIVVHDECFPGNVFVKNLTYDIVRSTPPCGYEWNSDSRQYIFTIGCVSGTGLVTAQFRAPGCLFASGCTWSTTLINSGDIICNPIDLELIWAAGACDPSSYAVT